MVSPGDTTSPPAEPLLTMHGISKQFGGTQALADAGIEVAAGEIDVDVDHGLRRDEIGKMANAIHVFRKNIIDKDRIEQTLAEAIEAITEGFSLYDAEDKLVVCNSHYREMFAYGPDTVIPGMSFERIVGSAVGRVVVGDVR